MNNPNLPPARRRFFVIVTIAIPLAALAVLELCLRVFGYGPDLSLFHTEVVDGSTYYVMNPTVGVRYFSRSQFVPASSTQYFTMPKPAGTFRIFCLGGSTAIGYPYWYNASFSTFLHDRLRRLVPRKSIETIDLGMTAINSYSVLDIARELPAYSPDLLLVYDGHNEFYGALGVASRGAFPGSRWLALISLRLVHFKVYLLLRDGFDAVRSLIAGRREGAQRGVTLETMAEGQTIPYGSGQYKEGVEEFRANLQELCAICRNNGIPLILCTQVSNLRDRPPFLSHQPFLPGDPLGEGYFSQLYAGDQAGVSRNWAVALGYFRRAMAYDTLSAGLHFAVARSLDSLGRRREAGPEYVRARDDDELRFRASSDVNAEILRCASGAEVAVVDMERVFRDASPDSLIGSSLILDHLHPNSRGSFLMARAIAAAMEDHGLPVAREDWLPADSGAETKLWNGRPVTALDERIAARRTEYLLSTWPFTRQARQVSPVLPGDTIGQIAEGIAQGSWGWRDAHEAAQQYYERRHDDEGLEREYRTMVSLIPQETGPRMTLAGFYIRKNRPEEARQTLLDCIAVKPTMAAYRALGDLEGRAGNPDEAVGFFEKAAGLAESAADRTACGMQLAQALANDDQPERAEAELARILAENPDHREAQALLWTLKHMSKLRQAAAKKAHK